MTAEAPDTAVYAEDRARNWEAFVASTDPLADYWARWIEFSHDWKVPIEFLQPVGADNPQFIEPVQPLLDTLAGMEEVEVFPVHHMYVTSVHVGLLRATDIMWSQVESIYVNASPRLHRLEPFTLRFGGVSAFEDSLYLGVDDGFALREVRRLVRLGVPTVYERARDDTAWDDFIPHVKIAGFTGKGSRQQVIEAVTPYRDAAAGEITIDLIKMARIPVDPDNRHPEMDVIAAIQMYGKDHRSGYHA